MDVRILKPEEYAFINEAANHPLQSVEWGNARAAMGTEIVRFGSFVNNKLVRTFLMTLHPIPLSPYKLGYIPRSLLPTSDELAFLQEYGNTRKLIFIKLEPDASANETTLLEIQKLRSRFPLRRSPHQLFPDWTMVLDISLSEEELFASFKPKTRYNIRLAQKRGVVVREASDAEGFNTFVKLYFSTTARQGYLGHNERYHRIVWEALSPSIASILLAEHEGTPLAAYELFRFKNTLYYPYGGSSDQKRNLMGANAIMWEAIRYGKKCGCVTFDMWGSSPPTAPDDDPYAGFTRFKEGYGARFVEKVGSWDLVLSSLGYSLFTAAHGLRQNYLRMKLRRNRTR